MLMNGKTPLDALLRGEQDGEAIEDTLGKRRALEEKLDADWSATDAARKAQRAHERW